MADPQVWTPTDRWFDMGASCSSTGPAGRFPFPLVFGFPVRRILVGEVGEHEPANEEVGDEGRLLRRVRGEEGEVDSFERKV
jgi:hypothetical protein